MSPRKEFEVLMYESEYRQIQAWVDKYQDLETGGDLFGLWADDHTAVVQLVLGPGKGCRRSSVSFYQDVEYLDRVGNLLTHEEGLCHIGEWHSHHRLGLTRPSGGDENTVWTNMDRYGIHRFFLFIATIDYDVNIGCFLFEIDQKPAKRKPVLKGRITQISNAVESPFRVKVRREFQYLATGAETLNSPKSLKKFVPKNATIEQKSRKITTEISTRCDNERPTTVTTVLEEKGNREKRQVKNQVYREAFLVESLDKTKNIEENPQEIQNYNSGHEKDHIEIPDNQEPEIQKLTSKDELPSTPAQGNIQNAQDNVVIHSDRNKPQTVHNQPLISGIKQNEPSSSVHSTQKYNEIKDQAGKIMARHDHDEPNAEDDQVQSTVHENLSKKAKMDGKDSNGSETTEQRIYKELRPAKNTKVTHVESVSRDDLKTGNQRDQTHQPIQSEVILSKETSPCESQQNRKHKSDLEIENKDIQPKERKRSNQIYPGIEAMNVQNEPSGSVLDQDLDGEDEKPVKSCWPRRKKKNEKETKKKEKEEDKEKKKGETQAKKNAKKEKKKGKKEAKENAKKEKRKKKEEKKKEKEEKKKLKKQAKTN